jgi:putative glutamine amidotransferase
MNVAFGGSLHQKVHELPGMLDHREADSPELAVQYAPAHAVTVQPGGVFEALELPVEFMVNSIHSQGIDRLAPGLRAEAIAPDGLIEAISVEHSPTFAVGVQWHPEWQVLTNPPYLSIFQAFGDACRRRAALRKSR